MFDRKKFNFSGGGLIDSPVFGLPDIVPDNFSSPAYVDGRPYCIETSNQGRTDHCAGYSMAGAKEVMHWRETGIRTQYDGDECYRVAKTIDGMPGVRGTSLFAAAQAAISLGWFVGDPKHIPNAEFLKWALHRYGCCVVGFRINSDWMNVNTRSGWIANTRNPRPEGGHAVLVCYYDRHGVGFQNSWGVQWGVSGFGRMTWDQFGRQFMHGVSL
jgi:hypothetical protein